MLVASAAMLLKSCHGFRGPGNVARLVDHCSGDDHHQEVGLLASATVSLTTSHRRTTQALRSAAASPCRKPPMSPACNPMTKFVAPDDYLPAKGTVGLKSCGH